MERFGRKGRRGELSGRDAGRGVMTWLQPLLKGLLFSYILTAAILLVLALLLYRFRLSENVISIAIIAIYVVATFLAGFIAGKKMQSRRFLWGLVMGTAYFVVLAVVSLIADQSPKALGDSFFTTLALCAAGGMLGGMLS